MDQRQAIDELDMAFAKDLGPRTSTLTRPVGPSLWVGVGPTGHPYYSFEGQEWVIGNMDLSPRNGCLRSVAYGDETFVATGNQILMSNNGIDWSTRAYLPHDETSAIAFANHLWVCVGQNGRRMTSQDGGQTWIDRTKLSQASYRDIVAGHGTFVAIGHTRQGRGVVNTTQDGEVWTGAELLGASLVTIAFGAGHFVATDICGCVYLSKDGHNWQKTSLSGSIGVRGVRYVNGVFLAQSTEGRHFWSLFGDDWTEEEGFLPCRMAYGGGAYVGSDYDGKVYTAKALDAWGPVATESGTLTDFAYGDASTR